MFFYQHLIIEFVGLHFALSTRSDTPYWRDIKKRTFPFGKTSYATSSDLHTVERNRYPPYGGLHCISTGLGWDATDLPTLMKHSFINTEKEFKKLWGEAVNHLSFRVIDWKTKARTCESSEEFTRKKIYDKDS